MMDEDTCATNLLIRDQRMQVRVRVGGRVMYLMDFDNVKCNLLSLCLRPCWYCYNLISSPSDASGEREGAYHSFHQQS